MNKQQVFNISNDEQFSEVALQIFGHQAKNCSVYRDFIAGLNIDAGKINDIRQIPFLPVEFFKAHKVVSSNTSADVTFTSSGTTGTITSRHHVTDVSLY